MKASVRFLLRDSAVYGLSNALVKLSALVSVPILTRALSQADYGATDALNVLLALLVAVATLGQDSAVARFFYDVESEGERRQVVMQGLVAQLAMTGVVAAVALAIGPWILRSDMGAAYAGAYYLIVACLPAVLLFQFWRGLLKWMLARGRFVALTVGTAAAQLLGVILLAALDALTVRTWVLVLLASNGLSAVIGLWFCRAYVTMPRGFTYVGRMLRYGGPYAAVLLVGTLLPAVDRAIVTGRLGLAPLAEYAVGVKYASLLLFPVMAFQTAWGPFCFATYKDPDAPAVYSRVLMLLASGLAIGCFALVALAEPLIRVFASARYVSAAPVVLPVVFGLALEACSWVLGLGIDLAKRSELSLASYVVGLVVSIAGAMLLVTRWGIVGVAVGIALGRVAQSATYSWFGLRVYPLEIRWRRPILVLWLALVASFIAAAVTWLVPTAPLLVIVSARVALFLLLVGAIVALFGPQDRAQAAGIWRRFGRMRAA